MRDIIQNFLDYQTNSVKGPQKSIELCYSDMTCNINCKYCFANHYSRNCKNSKPLNKEILKENFNKLDKSEIAAIHIWGGEPLFHKKEFMDTVSLLEECFPNTPKHIMTNATLLPEWTDYLIDHNIYTGLSHDGPAQKYRCFDYLTEDKFNNCIKRLYDKGLSKTFKSVIHNKNSSSQKIIEFFENYSIKMGRDFGNHRIIVSPNNTPSFIFKTPEEIASLKATAQWDTINIIKHLVNLDYKYIARFYQESDYSKILRFLYYTETGYNHNFLIQCSGTLKNNIAFTSDGKRVPCHCFAEKFVINSDCEVDLKYVYSKCSKCPYNWLCGGGCLAQSSKELDEYCNYIYHYYDGIATTLNNTMQLIKGELHA